MSQLSRSPGRGSRWIVASAAGLATVVVALGLFLGMPSTPVSPPASAASRAPAIADGLPTSSPSSRSATPSATADATTTVQPETPSPTFGAASPEPSASLSPSAVPGTALVPIVGFWATERMMMMDELRTAMAGRDDRFRSVVVADRDLAALTNRLGVGSAPTVVQATPGRVLEAVAGTTDTLGFVRASEVQPSVRALGIDGRSLFGNGRLRSIRNWPLTIPTSEPATGPAPTPGFDPAGTWTLVAAGDVMNDREVYRQSVILGKGADYPWAGGTAEIVRRTCCRVGLTTVTARRTGGAGRVASMFRDADLALVNHEGPAPDAFRYHPHGLVFTFDPSLEAGLRNAGIDAVSLANNHIRNAGSNGVIETVRNVTKAGMVPIGAGKNADAARKPGSFEVNGTRVAVLAYDAINLAANGATRTRPGAAPLDRALARADIAKARAEGADVVVVVPHWGVEYTSNPTAQQRVQAKAMIEAGADVILGSHSHWAGAMDAIGDGVVLYSMGDFIFDLPRSEHTEEAFIAELTFAGKRLVQIDIHPTLVLDRSQPNLLDPDGDGRVVLDRIRDASERFLDW